MDETDPSSATSDSSDEESGEVDFDPNGLEAVSGGYHQVHAVNVVDDTPQSFKDIEASPNKAKWLEATQDEYDSLVNNGTWTLTDLPPDRKALECKLIWRTKFDAMGQFTK
ncbi:hypothetical protein H310_14722 [Aphanomyces invadans]|uniref:Reverse transcriptase Ty1/copia-type domain-containing protein n=1 Tax=Aphanomyces invadans TaxID=157072 RepID=A0A024TAY3_9STRA|nr:hypothetical protein H310_14722 [Aphanomyces invadans]ETV90477.1 hypothetical protein H310_14722 [Aphanomyces invadans]|eukprot:XP_008880865.1 hypothetical protein H310_14722 [Aphanomyces invadans]